MKLAFTILGCPEWGLETALARGRAYGFDGIDFRGVGPFEFDRDTGRYVGVELDITRRGEFTTGLERTKGLIADSGLEVAGLSSGVRFAHLAPDRQGDVLDEGRRYIELAAKLRCPMVRVFAGDFDEGELELDAAKRNVVAGLRELAPAAADAGVTLGVETHDKWTATERLRAVLDEVDHPAVGALWDVNHPYRTAGESPEATWHKIGRRVCYTHFKDSVEVPAREGGARGGHGQCLVGDGTLPLRRIAEVLRAGGYNGYAALEWEKIWHPELPPAEEAFPRYVGFMKGLEA